MITCTCGKTFSSLASHQDHLRHSSRHSSSTRAGPPIRQLTAAKMALTCTCGRSFATDQKCRNHIRNSPKHAPSSSSPARNQKKAFRCACGKSFVSHGARADHIRDSPTHAEAAVVASSTPSTAPVEPARKATEFRCICNKTFASANARSQHLQDASRHAKGAAAPTTPSTPDLSSSQQIQQARSLPPAEKKFTCSCGAAFASRAAQADHFRDARVHKEKTLPHVPESLQVAQEPSATSNKNGTLEKPLAFAAVAEIELNGPERPATEPAGPSCSVETSDFPGDTCGTGADFTDGFETVAHPRQALDYDTSETVPGVSALVEPASEDEHDTRNNRAAWGKGAKGSEGGDQNEKGEKIECCKISEESDGDNMGDAGKESVVEEGKSRGGFEDKKVSTGMSVPRLVAFCAFNPGGLLAGWKKRYGTWQIGLFW